MSVKDEILFDFNINEPRVMVCGSVGIVDNVKNIVLISEKSIVISGKKEYVSITGDALTIKEIDDERVQVSGEIRAVEFFKTLS